MSSFFLIYQVHRGEVNWAPVIPDGEDENSLQIHIDWMKKEIQKASPDMETMKQKINVTYAQRRTFIDENPPLYVLKETYPALFCISKINNELTD